MNHIRLVSKVLGVAAVVLIGNLLIGGLLTAVFGNVFDNPPAFAEVFPPMALAALLTVAVLVGPVRRSSLAGVRLFGAVFATVLGLGVVLTNVEAFLFLVMPTEQLLFGVAYGSLEAALVSAIVVAVFGSGSRPQPHPEGEAWGPGRWLRRLALASVCYMVLYFVAGILIYPQVEAFYATQQMPGPWIIPFQLVRGLFYVLFSLTIIRSLVGSRRQASVAMGLLFPIVAGVAGLLIPNAFMPAEVRFWHALEIGWSNLVFGLLVGFLFWRQQGAGHRTVVADADAGSRSAQAAERHQPAGTGELRLSKS